VRLPPALLPRRRCGRRRGFLAGVPARRRLSFCLLSTGLLNAPWPPFQRQHR
jgi:hypothetical protein